MHIHRVLLRLVAAVFVLSIVDGCLHRDPRVELANGYEIVAICGSCPCVLIYRPHTDPREYSEWRAVPFGGDEYELINVTIPDGRLVFDSQEEWRQAWREKNAAPPFDWPPSIEDITEFNRERQYVIGIYKNKTGFFILDMFDDRIETWFEKAKWESAIRSKTSMSPDDLTDPKAWHVQSRDSFVFVGLAVVGLIMLPWVVTPLWRRRQ